MNARMNATQKHEEEIANAGVSPHVEKVPPVEEDANMEQALVNPSPLTDENIRTTLF